MGRSHNSKSRHPRHRHSTLSPPSSGGGGGGGGGGESKKKRKKEEEEKNGDRGEHHPPRHHHHRRHDPARPSPPVPPPSRDGDNDAAVANNPFLGPGYGYGSNVGSGGMGIGTGGGQVQRHVLVFLELTNSSSSSSSRSGNVYADAFQALLSFDGDNDEAGGDNDNHNDDGVDYVAPNARLHSTVTALLRYVSNSDGGGTAKEEVDDDDDDGSSGRGVAKESNKRRRRTASDAAPDDDDDDIQIVGSGGEDQEQLLSRVDVARLLLPWAVKGILRDESKQSSSSPPSPSASSDDVELSQLRWQTLEACLSVCVGTPTGRSKGGRGAPGRRGGGKRRRVGDLLDDGGVDGAGCGGADRAAALGSILTQSVLNRLVPAAANVAFQERGGEAAAAAAAVAADKSRPAAEAAAACFVLLTSSSLYRPTMDGTCTDLLLQIDCLVRRSRSSSSLRQLGGSDGGRGTITSDTIPLHQRRQHLLSQHQHDVVVATLTLLRRLQRGGASNPKKVFGLLTLPRVLEALSRLGRVMLNVEVNVESTKSTEEEEVRATAAEEAETMATAAAATTTTAQDIVRDVLWYGLFHPAHHVDGFRSMKMGVPSASAAASERKSNSPSKSKCYQQNLLQCLRTLLMDGIGDVTAAATAPPDGRGNGEVEEEEDVAAEGAVAAASIIPILVEGFIVQTTAWEEEREPSSSTSQQRHRARAGLPRPSGTVGGGVAGGGKRSSCSSSVTALQFQFWSCVMEPMIARLGGGGRLLGDVNVGDAAAGPALVCSIRRCLSLLLEYDVYLPSYVDPDNRNFSFLDAVAECILRRCEVISMQSSSSTPTAGEEAGEALSALRFLLEANHCLLHDRLPRVFAFAARCLPVSSRRADGTQSGGTIGGSMSERESSSRLLSSVVDTYGRLRQLEHLFAALIPSLAVNEAIPAASDTIEQDSEVALCSDALIAGRILDDSRVARALVQAVQNCPQGQVRPIWGIFDDWIVAAVKGGGGVSSQTKEEDLKFVLRMFILLMRSLRVDKYSAPETKELCEKAMASSVASLLDGLSSKQLSSTELVASAPITAAQGLVLCGWIVDLHTRCSFWLDTTINDLAESSLLTKGTQGSSGNVLGFLLDVVESLRDGSYSTDATSNARLQTITGALQHLACHRILQLHSMILEQEQMEDMGLLCPGGDDDERQGSKGMIEEAKVLTDFCIRAATARSCTSSNGNSEKGGHADRGRGTTTGAGWKQLAQTVATWAPYSSPRHVEAFLRWLFSTLAITDSDLTADRRPWAIRVFPTDEIVPLELFEEERAVTLSLIQDASFYEVPEVSRLAMHAGLACAVELIANVQSPHSTSRKRRICIEGIALVSPNDSHWSPLTSEQVVTIYQPAATCTISIQDVFARTAGTCLMDRALQLLRFVSGMPRGLSVINADATNEMDMLLRLDALMHICLRSCGEMSQADRDTALNTTCTCKAILVRVIAASLHSPGCISLFSSSALAAMLKGLYRSSIDVLEAFKEDMGAKGVVRFLSVSGNAVGELLSLGLSQFEDNAGLMMCFTQMLEEALNDRIDSVESASSRARVNLLRAAVGRMIQLDYSDGHELSTRNSASGKKARDACFRSDVFESKMWRTLVRCMERNGGRQVSCQKDIFAEVVLLFSDLLRFLTSQSTKDTDVHVSKAVDTAFITLTNAILREDTREASWSRLQSATFYFLSSVPALCAKHVKSADVSKQVLLVLKSHFITNKGCTNPLLDTSFCGILHRADSDQIRSLSQFLLEDFKTTTWSVRSIELASTIHAFHLMLLVTKGQSQKAELSSVGQEFVLLAMQLFYPLSQCSYSTREMWPSQIQLATRFVTDIIGKKDVLLLTSREVSVLLSQTMTVLPPLQQNKECHVESVCSDVYSSCCAILSSLLKQYPKQLYGCAPSLVSVLHSLLSHAIADSSSGQGANDSLAKSQELAKVFELLSVHKEIFKKHVVGLILLYVDALEAGMGADTKQNMMPAIYSLLDMCTKYEMHQLQVTMSISSKSIFQFVYRSFQKVHKYKGQF